MERKEKYGSNGSYSTKMTKLLLVNPYFKGETAFRVSSPPTSLGFLATYVRDHSDCEVELIDPIPQGLTETQVLSKVKQSNLVGLSCITDNRFQCFDFARKVKEVNPDCQLIVGGSHVNTLDKLVLIYYPFIDIIVRGEGEQTVLELVEDKPYKDIKGITWKEYKDFGSKTIQNPDRPFIEDIDSLYCDYSLFPSLDRYAKDIEASDELKKKKTVYIVASRGCPYKCSYCASADWNRTWRAVSSEELVRRMEYLNNQYGIEYFRFYDDLFTVNERRVFRFCELLKQSNLDIAFRVECRMGTKRSILEALNKVGCRALGMGVESGSDRVLKRISKGTTRDQILKTIKIAKELDYWLIGFFMISMPDETKKDYQKSLELLKFFDVHTFGLMRLYPNTPFYDELKQRGELTDRIWFDRKFSDSLLYSRDNFASACFYQKDLRWLSQYAYYYHNLQCPKKVFERYGISKGFLALGKALVDIPLRGRIAKLYIELKEKKEEKHI